MPAMKPGVTHRPKGQPVTLDIIQARCDEVGDCWIWKGAYSHKAPAINIGGRSTNVRRFITGTLQGKSIKGRYVTVCCGDLKCVAPDHLRVVNRSQLNKQIADITGYAHSVTRSVRLAEARRRQARLSPEQVELIRQSSLSNAVLARQLGVAKSTVNDARRGDTWRDYTNPFSQLLRLAA